jgi:hypothetical protein
MHSAGVCGAVSDQARRHLSVTSAGDGCVIKDFGGNTFKQPYMSKEKLRKQGMLPKDLHWCETAFLAREASSF